MDNPVGEEPPLKPGGRRFIACEACRKRKSRCDAQRPACKECRARNTECLYQTRRFRGPGKSKEHRSKLEERIKQLEGIVKSSSASSAEPAENLQDRSKSPSASVHSNTQDPTKLPPPQSILLSQESHSSASSRQPSTQTPDSQPQNFVQKSLLAMHFLDFVRSAVKTDSFKMAKFSPQHTFTHVLIRVGDIVEEIRDMYPLLSMARFETLLLPQESDTSADTSARLAASNVALALGIQWKTANSAFDELAPASWAYLKSAFATVPLLLFQRSSELAYEALLIMAMYTMGSADLHITSHLNSLAVRAYQMREAFCPRQDGKKETASQLRAFWTLASIDIDVAFRIGIPPIMPDLTGKPLPSDTPSDPAWLDVPRMNYSINIMKVRAELDQLQHQAYHQLFSCAVKASFPRELSMRAEELDQDLENWKTKLPSAFQPSTEYQPGIEILPLPIIMLHFVYHAMKIKLKNGVGGVHFLDSLQASARATIRLMHCLPTHQLAVVWRILVYPTSAALLLLAAVNTDADGIDVAPSLNGLRELTHCLHDICTRKKCDVGLALPWFSSFEEAAAERVTKVSDMGPPKPLSKVLPLGTDYLRLAQSFVGKMAEDDAVLIQKLSEVLGISWTPEDEFGPFVPKSLKPSTYNFTFDFAE